jgi:hypothetical protein
MKTITVSRGSTNVTALDETLRTALGADYLGLSLHAGEVQVHLVDSTPSEQVKQAEQLVINHDPSLLTVEQQAELDEQQALAQLRLDNPTALDISAYDGSNADVQSLAAKIVWLELEVRELRGL